MITKLNDSSTEAIGTLLEREVARMLEIEVPSSGQRWARHTAISRLLRAAESIAVDDLLNDREQYPPRLEKIRQLRELQAAEFARLMATVGE